MAQITINVSREEFKAIEKRAKKGYMSVKEQVEDIIRRSMVNYRSKFPSMDSRIDDKLVSLFSRTNKGRRKK